MQQSDSVSAEHIQSRADELCAQRLDQERRGIDRLFLWLLLSQWVFAILLAAQLSPYAWQGKVQSVHFHVYMAVFFGGLINALPIALILLRPGWVGTRYAVAIVQMMWSALLIHLTAGRIETHFHVFGSLAFLACYKDWRVLVPATLTVAVDHFARGLFWPESVYGTLTPEWWRFLEHAGWVLFEDGVLVLICQRGLALDRIVSEREARLEAELVDRAAREEELRRARLAADAANRAKSEFLANMSHEIRTPMNGVLGFTDLLLDTPLDTEQREQVRTIRQSADSLLLIINDILDFSKIEAGRLEVERIAFDLPRAMEEVAGLLAPQAQRKGLALALRIDRSLPAIIESDPGRIRQILLNLVGNALKFTRHGHVFIEAGLRPATANGQSAEVRVAVTDTGVGIPREKQSLLFREFSQVDASTTREFGGTGLGLAISKRLVEIMGGSIGFTSEPGHGSCFWFTLPAPSGALQCEPIGSEKGSPVLPKRDEQPRSARASEMAAASGILALVAEDNAVNQCVARRLLEKLGCRVDVAADGKEAIAMVLERQYDIVFMDCFMPEMDGYRATEELRRRQTGERRLPIIALTASAMAEDRARCMAAGMDDYLTKPVRVQDLWTVLQRWACVPDAVTEDGV